MGIDDAIYTEGRERAAVVDETPASNSFRYLIMRTVRLVATVFCELLMILSAVLFCAGLFITFARVFEPSRLPWAVTVAQMYPDGPWWQIALLTNSVLVTLISFFICTTLCGIGLAFGMPYRWKWKMPGAGLVICRSCDKTIADDWSCSECKAPRAERVLTWLCELANRLVLWLWILHDVTIGLITLIL